MSESQDDNKWTEHFQEILQHLEEKPEEWDASGRARQDLVSGDEEIGAPVTGGHDLLPSASSDTEPLDRQQSEQKTEVDAALLQLLKNIVKVNSNLTALVFGDNGARQMLLPRFPPCGLKETSTSSLFGGPTHRATEVFLPNVDTPIRFEIWEAGGTHCIDNSRADISLYTFIIGNKASFGAMKKILGNQKRLSLQSDDTKIQYGLVIGLRLPNSDATTEVADEARELASQNKMQFHELQLRSATEPPSYEQAEALLQIAAEKYFRLRAKNFARPVPKCFVQ